MYTYVALLWPHDVHGVMVSFLVQKYRVDAKYNLIFMLIALFKLLVWPHEVEPWFHSWYKGRVETLDAK